MRAAPSRIARWWKPLAALVALTAFLLFWRHSIHEYRQRMREAGRAASLPAHPAPLPGARIWTTAHYRITTTATPAQTRQVGEAVEALHAAYTRMFPPTAHAGAATQPLALTLYADQGQFKANNRSHAWAEAYYLDPVCYAYVAAGARNPYHWMTHEATHQLNRQVSGMRNPKWIEEGLASYFGSSRIVDGQLHPGEIDPDAYPIWWLIGAEHSSSLDADLKAHRWIPLRALITGIGAPSIDANVNRYYIEYWSLTHFLLNGDGGRHADAYRRLIAAGGTLENFERLIGPVERVEKEWHEDLQRQIAALNRTQQPR